MKTMKKSMFITTIMMVVLLVVALSTATFAWYTSSSNASSTATKLSSATSNSANIALGWTTTAKTTSVSFDNGTGLNPMVPMWKNENAIVAPSTAIPTFVTGTLQRGADGTDVFKDNGGSATPWTQKQLSTEVGEGGTAATTLYCINYNTAAAATVTLTATITAIGENADKKPTDMIRIGVAVGGEWKGIIGEGNYTKAKKLETEWKNQSTSEATDTATCLQSIEFTIPVASDANGASVSIALYAWFDGSTLVDSLAGSEYTFALNFQAK